MHVDIKYDFASEQMNNVRNWLKQKEINVPDILHTDFGYLVSENYARIPHFNPTCIWYSKLIMLNPVINKLDPYFVYRFVFHAVSEDVITEFIMRFS